MSSNAPPSARPLIAATHGLPEVSMLAAASASSLRLSSNNSCCAASSPFAFLVSAKTLLMPSSIDRSAPAEKASLPEVITTPLTAASAVVWSTMAPSSSTVVVSSTFIERPGMSHVTSAMPSASVSILKFLKVMCRSQFDGAAIRVWLRQALAGFFSPPPCGEGSGVGVSGSLSQRVWCPPPRPSPARGEGADPTPAR